MKSHLPALLTFTAALAWTSSGSVLAETLNLQLDSENSAITISGTVEISGISVPLTEQGPNSLVAKYAGNIPVDVAGGNIRFPGGAAIRALEPNDWKPGVGGAAGTAKASYGAKATATIVIFTVNAFAASRNLILDATSANLPLTSGQFPGGNIDFKFADTANTTLDFAATGFVEAQGTKILSGLLTNRVASVASFAGPVGEETLTIPVHSSIGFEAASDTGTVVKFQLRFDGQLVAKRATVVEEPVVAFTPPTVAGAPISLNWSKSYKLQRATQLNPPNWADVVATSPITIPPIQPGEYFRVVKK